jgi:dihydroorotase
VYDLLIAGGTVVDPAQGLHARRDVAIRDGVVVELAEALPRDGAEAVLEAGGKVVTPGLVDVHGHFFHGYTTIPGVADELCLPGGVTTAADAGTSGYATFPAFRDYVFPTQRTRLRAWLSIAASGYLMSRVLGTEFHDPRVADVEATAGAIRTNPETVVGVKLRLQEGLQADAAQARELLDRALAAARLAEVPLMVHVFRTPIPLAEVFERLAPGDVVTHAFHGPPNGILGDDGRALPQVRAAYERGVLLDAGYAGGLLCDLDVARAAIEQGLPPATLGTDLVDHRVAPPNFYGTAELVGLFVALGLELEDALAAATSRAADAIGAADVAGSLRPGAPADAAVFSLVDGAFRWHGAGGQSVEGSRRLAPEATVRAGAVVWRAGDPASTPVAEQL